MSDQAHLVPSWKIILQLDLNKYFPEYIFFSRNLQKCLLKRIPLNLHFLLIGNTSSLMTIVCLVNYKELQSGRPVYIYIKKLNIITL